MWGGVGANRLVMGLRVTGEGSRGVGCAQDWWGGWAVRTGEDMFV